MSDRATEMPTPPALPTPTTVPEAVSPTRQTWQMFYQNRAAMLGLCILLVIIITSIVGPLLYTVPPREMVWMPLTIGFAAAVLTVLIGVTIGALAGFFGGWVDTTLMKVTEFFQVLPNLLFAMVVVMLFSPTLTNIAIAIGIVSWTATARLTRAEFLRIREMDYVKAERSIGAGNSRLSDPNAMSWGRMVGDNRPYILDSVWGVTIPGLAIFLTVLAISLVGDGLNDAINPKLRQR